MLTLDQLILEATALPDSDKAILIDKIMESMTRQIDQDISIEGVKKAQGRIAEVDNGAVQPGTLTGLRGIAKRAGAAPNDDDL